MMAVTHELKTPISVARLNLETLQKYTLDPEKQKKLIRMTLAETERLNSLTNNILLSAQLEADRYKSAMEELDLSDLFRDSIVQFQNRYPEKVSSRRWPVTRRGALPRVFAAPPMHPLPAVGTPANPASHGRSRAASTPPRPSKNCRFGEILSFRSVQPRCGPGGWSVVIDCRWI